MGGSIKIPSNRTVVSGDGLECQCPSESDFIVITPVELAVNSEGSVDFLRFVGEPLRVMCVECGEKIKEDVLVDVMELE